MKCPFHHALRSDLPPLTERIAKLPVDERGYPIPFFVAYPNGQPDFRIADGKKQILCRIQKLCWVCGGKLSGERKAFVIGPMCTINRVSAEPPSHLDCAEWSVKGCPFLTKPSMTRRQHDDVEAIAKNPGGEMIMRNPGCMAIWETDSWQWFSDGRGGTLVQVGEPVSVTWWREGRRATRAEVIESIDSGLPSLQKGCADAADHALLKQYTDRALAFLPA